MTPFKQIVDLSVPLKSMDTPLFPGTPIPLRTTYQTIQSSGFLAYIWLFHEHSGTHVDAPAHMMNEGMTIDKVPLDYFVCSGVVLDFSGKPKYQITRDDIKKFLKSSGHLNDITNGGDWVLLFYTGYTSKSNDADWLDSPDLTEDACKYIVELGFKGIGIDAFGPDHAPWSAHRILLPNNVLIFENLANLDKLVGKEFMFVGVPIPLFGGSAGLVRPIALVS
jgi:arylformamidase